MSEVASDENRSGRSLDMPLSAVVLDEALAAEGCANLALKFKHKSIRIAMVGEKWSKAHLPEAMPRLVLHKNTF